MKLTTQVKLLTAGLLTGMVSVCAVALYQSSGSAGVSGWILFITTVFSVGSVVGAVMLVRNLSGRLAFAKAQADEVASLNLAVTHSDRGDDEVGELVGALDRMRKELSNVVLVVRQNSDSVATASAQIAQGNQDLSGRTEQQASSLQQTAASMDVLGSTVTQNADNARQANQLAQGASSVAARGGEVVAQVVTP